MKRLTSKAAVVLLGLASFVGPAGAADVDLTAGVLRYGVGTDPTANILTVSLTGGTYTIADPAEIALTLGTGALAAGCVAVDASTVTCPAAAVTSFDLSTRLGADTIDLTGAVHPAIVTAGDGADTILGGAAGDSFVWNPGDDNDVVSGGPGDDTLFMNGNGASETFVIVPDGDGFDLQRNVAAVHMDVDETETLRLTTAGGTDNVLTHALVGTTQLITDGDDAAADLLTLDAAGLCPFLRGESFEVVGRQPVQFTGFQGIATNNAVCGALVELAAGTLSYRASTDAVNVLDVSRDGGTYTLRDTGEVLLSLSPEAVAAGCANVEANAVACPESGITGFDVRTSQHGDAVTLTSVVVPAIVDGGFGNDTIVGGDDDDTFVWFPGSGSDVLDGGAGDDTLAFNGSNIAERFDIAADGTGFELRRNIAAILLEVQRTERLELATLGGQDEIVTTSLLYTAQQVTTGTDTLPDTLSIDADGLCPIQQGNAVEFPARPSIVHLNVASVVLSNVFCRADPCHDLVATNGCTVNGVRNQLCQGTDGDDVIVGTVDGDAIVGGGGRDRIRAGSGDDLVCGGEGDDVLIGAHGSDILVGGPGADRVGGDSGDDTVIGGDDADDLRGGRGHDDLDGGLGDDRLRAGGDEDLLRGGDGIDAIDGGSGGDLCSDSDQDGPFKRCEGP